MLSMFRWSGTTGIVGTSTPPSIVADILRGRDGSEGTTGPSGSPWLLRAPELAAARNRLRFCTERPLLCHVFRTLSGFALAASASDCSVTADMVEDLPNVESVGLGADVREVLRLDRVLLRVGGATLVMPATRRPRWSVINRRRSVKKSFPEVHPSCLNISSISSSETSPPRERSKSDLRTIPSASTSSMLKTLRTCPAHGRTGARAHGRTGASTAAGFRRAHGVSVCGHAEWESPTRGGRVLLGVGESY